MKARQKKKKVQQSQRLSNHNIIYFEANLNDLNSLLHEILTGGTANGDDQAGALPRGGVGGEDQGEGERALGLLG